MINAGLIVLEIILCYAFMVVLYTKYKSEGLYIYAITASIASSLMILKSISIMSINIPLGFGIITSLIIGGNLLTQLHGKVEIKNYILVIIATIAISSSIIYLSSIMESSNYLEGINNSYNYIFENYFRLILALITSLVISIYLSSTLYYLLKRIRNMILISNILSVIIVEFVENIIYVIVAYLFELNTMDIALCIVFRYIIKTFLGIIGTIPIYIITKYNQ